jgi:hypothetical protein
LRNQGSFDLQRSLPNQSNLLVEYALHNLSDADIQIIYTNAGLDAVASEMARLKAMGII